MVDDAYNKKNISWKCSTEVMWIFYMYSLKAEKFLQNYREGNEPYSLDVMISTQNAVKMVLEEFTKSNECQVYDTEPNELEGVELSGVRKIKKNSDSGIERFELKRLRLCHLFETKVSMVQLMMFWAISEKSKVSEILEQRFKQTNSHNVPLCKYIEYLITLQRDFRSVLKAIVMRIIVVYFLYKKQVMGQLPVLSIPILHCNSSNLHNRNIINGLKEFAIQIGQPNDVDINIVIKTMKKKNEYRINSYIKRIMHALKNMASVNSDFAPFTDKIRLYENFAREWLASIIREVKYDFEDLDRLDYLFLPTVIRMIVDIYVEFIQKITRSLDFGVINSLISLKESNHYKRLKELETNS